MIPEPPRSSPDSRRSSTVLPPVRRTRKRDWGKLFARILCVLFAILGVIPIGLGVLARTPWARALATRETRAIVAKFGIDASYELKLELWPLQVSLENLRVEANDGLAPFASAKRISARPKIFGLLAGKVVIDQIEIDKPKVRVVVRDGKIKNLDLNLPDSPKSEGPMKAPFAVVSLSEAEIDVSIDDARIRAKDIDADVTTDEDEGFLAFEVALRMAEAKARVRRTTKPAKNGAEAEYAYDDDTLCAVDGRARIEPGRRVLVRRFAAHGAVDFDPEPDTFVGCDLAKTDKRFVELALGHFSATFPKTAGDLPNLDGHAKVRAPLTLLKRLPDAPDIDGWVSADAELRYTPETPLPDLSGRLEAKGIRVSHFSFARSIKSDVTVRRGVVTSSLTSIEIADGVADIHDAVVQPLVKGLPISVASVDIRDVSFTSLMQDLGVSKRPHVTWDLKDVHAIGMKGTLDPLHLDGDYNAKTYNFAVYDAFVEDPARSRATGVKEAALVGKLGVRPDRVEFQNTTVTLPRSLIQGVFVSLGFHEVLKVDVPKARIDLTELTPLGSVPMAGIAEVRARVAGEFGSPNLEGEVDGIKDFMIGDIPFGNVLSGKVTADIGNMVVGLKDVHAQKGKSLYEMPTGKLDFGGPAVMQLDGQATSKSLNVRDFFAMFKLEDDPRLAEIDGDLETSARIHLALGGPEDKCKSGFVDVVATTNAKNLNLLGEKFDEGHADFEYRWDDRVAGIEGADIDVRSLSLTKVKKAGRAALGSVLGSMSSQKGQLRGSFVVQNLPLARVDMIGPFAKNLEGSISGVARLGGTISAFEVATDLGTTPIRVLGAPFGPSDLHAVMTQKPSTAKPIGKTACGAPIPAAFDKDAYLRDTSSQGDFKVDGALFGGQVKLAELTVSRQKAPVVTGKLALRHFDLGPLGKLLVPADENEVAVPSAPLGGDLSGDVVIERLATNDIAHAKATFTPSVIRVTRSGQKLEMREAKGPLALADDRVSLPKMTFDLAAPNGFKGAFAVNGEVKKITRGADLAVEAELYPIDLGILVGMVPKVTRATGTLSGSVKISGSPSQPDLDGQVRVRGGEFAIKGVPGTISDVEIDASADETEARITRAVGHFLGGDVSATARMPLKGGQIGTARATVTARQLYVAPMEGVRSTVDADLEVTLNPNASSAAGRLPFVGGEVNITSFEYTRPITVDLTGFKGGARRTTVEAYDPSSDSVSFGIDVRSRTPLRIRNNLVDAQLAIDQRGLHVSGTNQRMGLRGEMTTIPGGRFRVFANDFEVQKGTIRFDDPTRIAPHVDITGVTDYRRYSNTVASAGSPTTNTTGGAAATTGNISSGGRGGGLWRITLHAYGDTEDLKVDMTSDPALSREDIFFLLTIGLTRAEVDQVRAGSVYASAAFEAIGTVSGADRAVKTALPVIDDFRFGSAYSARTGRTEPQVTLGRRLTENVRANVSTGLTEDRQLRSNVEWRLSRPLSVQASYDNISTVSSGSVGNFGLDFRWRLEFD